MKSPVLSYQIMQTGNKAPSLYKRINTPADIAMMILDDSAKNPVPVLLMVAEAALELFVVAVGVLPVLVPVKEAADGGLVADATAAIVLVLVGGLLYMRELV
jgi:hypothetical protein